MARAAGDGRFYQVAVINQVGAPVGKRIELPSVTTILDALPKYLQWWGYKLGLEAGRELVSLGEPTAGDIEDLYDRAKALGRQGKVTTPSNVLKKAGKRGADIHDIAESFFKHNHIPDPADIPKEHHGYVKALAKWHRELGIYETVLTEQPVFSLQHHYAGTLDLLLKFPNGTYTLYDFKTSKDIFDSALIQLGAYAYALKEMGLVPEDAELNAKAVNLQASGKYKEQVSTCTIEDFLSVKKVWHLLQRLEKEKEVLLGNTA